MNLNVFPPIYVNELESRVQKDIQTEIAQNKEQVNKLTGSKNNISTDTGSWISDGASLGLIIGFFACIGVCNSSGYSEGFTTMLACAFFGGVIGFVVFLVDIISAPGRKSAIDNKIKQSNYDSGNKVSTIQRTKEQKISEYVKAFENEVQNQSVRLAESKLAKEVIAWMTNGFCETVASADRRPYIEQINVPFIFNIYKEKITCNLGIFDFEIKRCRNLNGPVEQTALARAIASTIQLNLFMKYPKDISGTDISITIVYNYTNDCVITSITYVAPNGNYQRAKEW